MFDNSVASSRFVDAVGVMALVIGALSNFWPAAGGAAIAELADDKYLVTGLNARIVFMPARELQGEQMIIARVEEGHFEKGEWVFERVWNGDQIDWGLNFSDNPHILQVRLATYETPH